MSSPLTSEIIIKCVILITRLNGNESQAYSEENKIKTRLTRIWDNSCRRRLNTKRDTTGPENTSWTEIDRTFALHPAVHAEATGEGLSLIKAFLWKCCQIKERKKKRRCNRSVRLHGEQDKTVLRVRNMRESRPQSLTGLDLLFLSLVSVVLVSHVLVFHVLVR